MLFLGFKTDKKFVFHTSRSSESFVLKGVPYRVYQLLDPISRTALTFCCAVAETQQRTQHSETDGVQGVASGEFCVTTPFKQSENAAGNALFAKFRVK